MSSTRILYVLFVALATLLMSCRPPAPPVARQAVLMDEVSGFNLEHPGEETGGEESAPTGQQGPLEEIHDLHCLISHDHRIDLRFGSRWTSGNLQIQKLGIALMSCFQPPEVLA